MSSSKEKCSRVIDSFRPKSIKQMISTTERKRCTKRCFRKQTRMCSKNLKQKSSSTLNRPKTSKSRIAGPSYFFKNERSAKWISKMHKNSKSRHSFCRTRARRRPELSLLLSIPSSPSCLITSNACHRCVNRVTRIPEDRSPMLQHRLDAITQRDPFTIQK